MIRYNKRDTNINTKYRTRLDEGSDLRCVLSQIIFVAKHSKMN